MYRILHTDSIPWLRKQPDGSLPNIVTGIPDMNEINLSVDEYISFLRMVMSLLCQKVHPNGYLILIQTDRKYNRTWIDKSYHVTDIATQHGLRMIWHKIVLQRNVGQRNLFRPTYSHILCYSQQGTTGRALPDVLPVSQKEYENSTPINAVELSVEFICAHRRAETKEDYGIIDPFCGRGTIPLVCQKRHIPCIGIDIEQNQVEYTKRKLKRI